MRFVLNEIVFFVKIYLIKIIKNIEIVVEFVNYI